MIEARWKLSVDEDGVTIAGDGFRLTTAPHDFAADDVMFGLSESVELESIVSGLEAMTRRPYGQYCGLARAMEVLGERWSALIIRDLLVSPRGFTALHKGIPRIPEVLLGTRLRELERAGIVQHTTAPDGETTYAVTGYGRELEDVVLRLGRWGARMLGDPRPEDIVTPDSLVMALRATFRPEHATGVTAGFELHVAETIVHARIVDGALHAGAGPLPDADLVIEPGQVLRALMT
ncbi:helix-turn-helix domain-containing protein, partial [Actinophytocola sp.]|uniref:winged helix-turn-helix transcriptional regulator n=1 Tax=Actinophytocola sp. TaxID=1872138 RepID=UPI002D7E5FB3